MQKSRPQPAWLRRLIVGMVVVFVLAAASVPLIFLFYGALGSALFGMSILATLIALQGLVAWPIWKRLQVERRSVGDDSN